ncbi:MAG TPA: hypothetical protein VG457_10815 [Planctomycetota bacterium]|jgi:hypothetical protein|nr:hypothetical protein [Planctomycetota bacterium]
MKIFVATMALVLGGAGIASAQEDPDRKADQLRRELERSLKALQEKFDVERERLQKEFKAARERLLEKKEEPGNEKPRDLESMVRELLKRVDSLEKKLDTQLPKLRDLPRELPRLMPKDFDFKRFQDGVPDEWRRWLEQMPRFRGAEDFKFEFRRAEPKKEQDRDPERKEKPKKKPERDDSY